MDALKIAFETIIVGALALPWIALLVDLFSPTKEQLLNVLLDKLKDQSVAAVAGALLFAMAYLVGSSVARLGEDFFNDEDLRTKFTEDEIRTSVYCRPTEPWLIDPGISLTGRNGVQITAANICTGDMNNNVSQAFSVQESSLLLAGPDKTESLRYLHQQMVVLRGASFDGLIITLLSLFGFCAIHGRAGRLCLILLSLLLFAWALYATIHHLGNHWHNLASEPPLMEGLLFAIALGGISVTRRSVPDRAYGYGLIFSALLTMLAFSGWWSSEVLYDRTVIFNIYAFSHNLPH
ncbi:MAG TPA: hypothetical protein VI386_27850 [Candidatus Sulfotelmatobacter sp.]